MSASMPASTTHLRDHAPSEGDDQLLVTVTLDPDSHECPDCGVISVPCDDRSARPEDVHRCRR